MNKASSKYLMIAGLTGAVAVAIGAFGAHGIKPHLDEYQLGIFKTGNQYHFYHALAMLLVAFLMSMNSTRYNKWAFYSFLIGVILFSGSLYLLATRTLLGIEEWKWLGPMTPIGGVFFILGWLMIAYAAFKEIKN